VSQMETFYRPDAQSLYSDRRKSIQAVCRIPCTEFTVAV
jgi:hypothetical protein